jgi:hypothetical protein
MVGADVDEKNLNPIGRSAYYLIPISSSRSYATKYGPPKAATKLNSTSTALSSQPHRPRRHQHDGKSERLTCCMPIDLEVDTIESCQPGHSLDLFDLKATSDGWF